jgi:hypothetical protein
MQLYFSKPNQSIVMPAPPRASRFQDSPNKNTAVAMPWPNRCKSTNVPQRHVYTHTEPPATSACANPPRIALSIIHCSAATAACRAAGCNKLMHPLLCLLCCCSSSAMVDVQAHKGFLVLRIHTQPTSTSARLFTEHASLPHSTAALLPLLLAGLPGATSCRRAQPATRPATQPLASWAPGTPQIISTSVR